MLGYAAVFAVGMGICAATPAQALGKWDCARVEAAVVEVEQRREAMLSHRFQVNAEGFVDVVKIYVEQPDAPQNLYQRVVHEVLRRLGLEPDQTATRSAARDHARWTISPAGSLRNRDVVPHC